MMRGTDLSDIRSGALASSVAAGDEAVKRLIEGAAESIGTGVANVIHILCPDLIVLGGGLVEAMEDLIVGTVEKTARASVMEAYRDRFRVVAAELGDDAGVKGAAAWARRTIEDASWETSRINAKDCLARIAALLAAESFLENWCEGIRLTHESEVAGV